MKKKSVNIIIYYIIANMIILSLIILEQKYIGSSGRSSLRLEFLPKSWSEIYLLMPKNITASTLSSMFSFYLYYLYSKKSKE